QHLYSDANSRAVLLQQNRSRIIHSQRFRQHFQGGEAAHPENLRAFLPRLGYNWKTKLSGHLLQFGDIRDGAGERNLDSTFLCRFQSKSFFKHALDDGRRRTANMQKWKELVVVLS